jgi:hypothetical protein
MLGAISLFTLSLFEWIHKSSNKNFKALFYGGFGCSMIIPMSHILINELVYANYGDKF